MKTLLKIFAVLLLLLLLFLVFTKPGRSLLYRLEPVGQNEELLLQTPVAEEEKLNGIYDLVLYWDSEEEISEEELEELRKLGISLYLDLSDPEEGLLQLFDTAFPVRLDEEAMQLIWEEERYDLTPEGEILSISEGETLLCFRRISDSPD